MRADTVWLHLAAVCRLTHAIVNPFFELGIVGCGSRRLRPCPRLVPIGLHVCTLHGLSLCPIVTESGSVWVPGSACQPACEPW